MFRSKGAGRAAEPPRRWKEIPSPFERDLALTTTTVQHEDQQIELVDLRPERLLEIVGEDLMMGADRARIIERLAAERILATPDVLAQIDRLAESPVIQVGRRVALRLKKRSWLLSTLFRLADDAGQMAQVPRVSDLSPDAFLHEYYARNLPVIVAGAAAGWPAVARWTPDYLKQRIGDHMVQVQADRTSDPDYELYKDRHARQMPFSDFVDQITRADGARNDLYMTAYNASQNDGALSAIRGDMGMIDRYLDPTADNRYGLMWIGPAGTVTPMHHDLTNNLLVQVAGRKVIKLVPAIQADAMYNHIHVFSALGDIEHPAFDMERFPDFAQARVLDVTLLPGDALFLPIGWWHQVRSLDFSVTLTYTNFLWNNSHHQSYPV
jgi:hypothetical protein